MVIPDDCFSATLALRLGSNILTSGSPGFEERCVSITSGWEARVGRRRQSIYTRDRGPVTVRSKDGDRIFRAQDDSVACRIPSFKRFPPQTHGAYKDSLFAFLQYAYLHSGCTTSSRLARHQRQTCEVKCICLDYRQAAVAAS